MPSAYELVATLQFLDACVHLVWCPRICCHFSFRCPWNAAWLVDWITHLPTRSTSDKSETAKHRTFNCQYFWGVGLQSLAAPIHNAYAARFFFFKISWWTTTLFSKTTIATTESLSWRDRLMIVPMSVAKVWRALAVALWNAFGRVARFCVASLPITSTSHLSLIDGRSFSEGAARNDDGSGQECSARSRALRVAG